MEEQSRGDVSFSVSESGANNRRGNETRNPATTTNGVRNTNSPKRRKKQYAVSVQWEQAVSEGRVPTDHNTFFCCCAKRIGHMFSLCSYADGTPVVIAGPCWPFCAFVTLPLILGITFCVSYFLIFGTRFELVSF